MKLRRSLYARPESVRGKCPRTAMHLGCSIGPAVGRLCQSPSADGVGRYSDGIIVGEAPIYFGKNQSRDDGGAERRRGRACRLARAGSVTLYERNTGLEARNHGVSGAEPVIGPELPEQVELVRAGLPDADRVRFEQDWTRRWTWIGRPGIWAAR